MRWHEIREEVQMKLVRAAAFAAGLLALAATAVACGGDEDSGDNGDATQPPATATTAATPTEEPELAEPTVDAQPTTAATAAATVAPGVDNLTVSAGDFAFSPNGITVIAGNDTAITLTNTGATPHSMKVYRDQAFSDAIPDAETQTISAGASDEFTLASTNVGGATQLFFRCEVHPAQMQGTITVR